MPNVLSSRNRRVRKFNMNSRTDSKRTSTAKKRSQYLRQARANKRQQFSA